MEIIAPAAPRRLNTFIEGGLDMKFGDFVLFQEYGQLQHDGTQYHYSVSRPVLAVFVSVQPCDQTVEMVYMPWQNVNRFGAYPRLGAHAEWSNYIDILGRWSHRPTWREILKAYRTLNLCERVVSDQMRWPA
jgi:hypothetical protein